MSRINPRVAYYQWSVSGLQTFSAQDLSTYFERSTLLQSDSSHGGGPSQKVTKYPELLQTLSNTSFCCIVSREQNKGMRLDYTVVDKPFFENHVLSAGICKDIGGSDHCPIWLSLKNLPAMPTVSSPPPLSSKRRKRPKPQATLLSFWAAKPSPPAEERKEKEQEPPPSPPAQEEEERSKPSQAQEDSTPTPEEETVVPQPTVKAPMRTPTLTTNRATEKKKATPAKRKGLEDPKQKNLLAFFKKKEEPSQQKKKFKSAEGT